MSVPISLILPELMALTTRFDNCVIVSGISSPFKNLTKYLSTITPAICLQVCPLALEII